LSAAGKSACPEIARDVQQAMRRTVELALKLNVLAACAAMAFVGAVVLGAF
jgi:hypothetical protein